MTNDHAHFFTQSNKSIYEICYIYVKISFKILTVYITISVAMGIDGIYDFGTGIAVASGKTGMRHWNEFSRGMPTRVSKSP
jgi:hypothetical protein